MVQGPVLWRAVRRGGTSAAVALLFALSHQAANAQGGSAIVVTREALQSTGRATLAEALQVLIPALNYPRPSGADLIDHVPPASLRGMRPDQLVVLVNGRRRHPSAIVGMHGTVGRGENPTDLNAIPLAAVERVEVWGPGGALGFPGIPGALAGVINIVLGERLPRELVARAGLTTEGDGTTEQIAGRYGAPWGSEGFVQLSAEWRHRSATNRASPDPREQFFPGDPRNDDPATRNQVHHRLGDAKTTDVAAVVHFSRALGGGTELFGSLSGNRRAGESASLWRRPNEDATVRALYPTGFLPLINSTIWDRSVHLGGRGRLGAAWRWELDAGYDANTVDIHVGNTANASLGPISPDRLAAGRQGSSALSADLTVRGSPSVGLAVPLALLLGTTVRREGYRIEAGERDSYRFGGVPIQDGPHAGRLAPLGAQGFPGFTPSDSFHRSRESIAGYVRAGIEPVGGVTLSGSGRTERYWSGDTRTQSTIAGSIRIEPVRGLSVRGSAGTGYRVPSLPERWFTYTTIPVVDNVGLFDMVIPSVHPIARTLGAFPLRAERSTTLSMGAELQAPNGRGHAAIEYYEITVRGRLGLTDRFAGSDLRIALEQAGYDGVGAIRVFANVADTRTTGFEAHAAYDFPMGAGSLRVEGGLDHHRVRVQRVDSTGGFLRQFPSAFFPEGERVRIESGQPADNASVAAILTQPSWRVVARARRYGSVRDFGPAPDGTLRRTYGARWLADLELSRRFAAGSGLTVSAGLQNVFGTTPATNDQGDATFAGNSYFGIFPFNSLSPFGFNGRFVYLRAAWEY